MNRIEALRELEIAAESKRYSAQQRLDAIDALLLMDGFSSSDLKRILEKRKYPIPIQKALTLYSMMARLTILCEPQAGLVGPACRVSLIDFETLTLKKLLDLSGLGLAFRVKPGFTNGLELLSAEERALYRKAKSYFGGRKKPTLKALGARLLSDKEDNSSFSDRAVRRYLTDLNSYEFPKPDQNLRRDYMIRSVNRFGSDREPIKQMLAQAFAGFNPHIAALASQSIASLFQFVSTTHGNGQN